jgi:DNA-binding XRE family transcriptional regulator
MYFSSNIKFLRKRRKRTQDDVAFSLKMKRSTLGGYENEVAQPGIEALIAFSKYFNISVDTLLKIDLCQLSESQLAQLEKGFDVFVSGSKLRVLTSTVDKQNNDNIELVPEKAKAGYTSGYADPEYIKELPVFQLPFLSKSKKYRTFQLKGDSMLPIPEGSWVTGEFVTDWRDIVSGYAYIVLTIDEGIVFKIVENLIEKEGSLMLYSLNQFYEPYAVSVNEIREVWKFVHYISSQIPDPALPKEDLIKTVAHLKHDFNLLKSQMLNKDAPQT